LFVIVGVKHLRERLFTITQLIHNLINWHKTKPHMVIYDCMNAILQVLALVHNLFSKKQKGGKIVEPPREEPPNPNRKIHIQATARAISLLLR
jgi:hypothetical protein